MIVKENKTSCGKYDSKHDHLETKQPVQPAPRKLGSAGANVVPKVPAEVEAHQHGLKQQLKYCTKDGGARRPSHPPRPPSTHRCGDAEKRTRRTSVFKRHFHSPFFYLNKNLKNLILITALRCKIRPLKGTI